MRLFRLQFDKQLTDPPRFRLANIIVLVPAYLTFRFPTGSALCTMTVLIACCCGCAPLTFPASNEQQFDALVLAHRDDQAVHQEAGIGHVDLVALESDATPEADVVMVSNPAGLTIAEIITLARTRHPLAVASERSIRLAEANVGLAGQQANPEFVIDIETPVHDETDATELSTRLTFPIGQKRLRKSRMSVARAAVATAIASHQATLRRLSENALSAAIRLTYLQERAAIDEQAEQLAGERMRLLSPEVRDGDAAANLVDYVSATEEAEQATRTRFDTVRDLGLARVALADAMGIDLADHFELAETLSVDASMEFNSLALPALPDVIAAAFDDSAELAVAQSATQKGWIEHQSSDNRDLQAEVGPLYQDRLGRDDDTIGVRFQTDVPLHDGVRDRILATGIAAQSLEDQVQIKRHEIAIATARDFREIESIAEQLRHHRSDTFIHDQQQILIDAEAQNTMTGAQMLRIQQAILDRRRNQLDLGFRFAMLRSRLRLHAVVPWNQ